MQKLRSAERAERRGVRGGGVGAIRLRRAAPTASAGRWAGGCGRRDSPAITGGAGGNALCCRCSHRVCGANGVSGGLRLRIPVQQPLLALLNLILPRLACVWLARAGVLSPSARADGTVARVEAGWKWGLVCAMDYFWETMQSMKTGRCHRH